MRDERDTWLRFAKEDLRMAELAMKDELWNQVCFHSQQSIEKALKSLFAGRNEVPPRSHKLADLLAGLSDDMFAGIDGDIVLLDRFYIPTRYPDALPGSLAAGLPGRAEAQEAFNVASAVIGMVLGNS